MFTPPSRSPADSAGPKPPGPGPGTSGSAPAVAEILTIGDELCRGEIVNTNASWLAERLTLLGFHVRHISSVTDDSADMAAALRRAAGRARVVVTSGGLGPTEDDRTVDVVSSLLGVAPTVDEAHRARMHERFALRGFEVTPNNLRQVRVPAGAEALTNRAGLAPGFAVQLADEGHAATVFSTPGVPREMKRIFDDEIEPRLRALLHAAGQATPATSLRVWRVAGLGESHVDHRLKGLLDGVDGASLHFRISYPENLVTVVVRRGTQAEADAVIEELDAEVRARLGAHVYGTGDATLAQVLGELLRARKETLAAAESCTGGLASDLVTDVAGSSDYFRGAVVAYDNAVKELLLGVTHETLVKHGAVSEECVREMAEGVRRLLGTTWGIAISGVAGPGGGTVDKPVGTVHMAVAGPSGTETHKLVWPAERRMIKQLSAFSTLYLLYRQLGQATTSASTGDRS